MNLKRSYNCYSSIIINKKSNTIVRVSLKSDSRHPQLKLSSFCIGLVSNDQRFQICVNFQCSVFRCSHPKQPLPPPTTCMVHCASFGTRFPASLSVYSLPSIWHCLPTFQRITTFRTKLDGFSRLGRIRLGTRWKKTLVIHEHSVAKFTSRKGNKVKLFSVFSKLQALLYETLAHIQSRISF